MQEVLPTWLPLLGAAILGNGASTNQPGPAAAAVDCSPLVEAARTSWSTTFLIVFVAWAVGAICGIFLAVFLRGGPIQTIVVDSRSAPGRAEATAKGIAPLPPDHIEKVPPPVVAMPKHLKNAV